MSKIREIFSKLFSGDPQKTDLANQLADELDKTEPNTKPLEQAKPLEPAKSTDDTRLSELTFENQALKSQLTEIQTFLKEERTERLKIQEEQTKAAKESFQKKIEERIKKGIEEGRIPPKNEEEQKKWRSLYEQNWDSAEFALSKIDAKKSNEAPNQEQLQNQNQTPSPSSSLGSSLRKSTLEYIKQVPIDGSKN